MPYDNDETPGVSLTPKPLGSLQMRGRYDLYVDASPGPIKTAGWSGWGMAMLAGDTLVYEACGTTVDRVTTNAAELEGIIHGLAYLHRLNLPTAVSLWTDSMYSAEAVAALPITQSRRYTDDKGKEIPNADRLKLIFEMLYDMQLVKSVIIRWVKGHNKTLGNEIADRLSKEAAYKGKAYYKEYHSQND